MQYAMINKRLVSILCGALAVVSLSAQEAGNGAIEERVEYDNDIFSVETNTFRSNWFVGVGGGAETFFGDHDKQLFWKDRITPAANVYVGRWFTPGMGLRFTASGWTLKGATHENLPYENFLPKHQVDPNRFPAEQLRDVQAGWMLFPQQWNYVQGRFDVLFNINQMVGGYMVNRFWSSIIYAGLGAGYTWDTADVIPGTEDHAFELGLTGGWLNTFRLTSCLDATLDITGTMFKDRFDGDYDPAVSVNPLARPQEGILSVQVGLAYNFGQRTDWGRTRTVTYIDNSYLNNLKDALAALDAENSQLKESLEACSTVEEVVEKVNIGSPIFVTFKIDKIDLSKKARVNLGYFADIIKKGDPEAVYIITGYADKGTGTVKRNKWLSEHRAQVVYECLIKEFGVNPDQLQTEFMGGVDNMFYDNPALSRAVISKVVKK